MYGTIVNSLMRFKNLYIPSLLVCSIVGCGGNGEILSSPSLGNYTGQFSTGITIDNCSFQVKERGQFVGSGISTQIDSQNQPITINHTFIGTINKNILDLTITSGTGSYADSGNYQLIVSVNDDGFVAKQEFTGGTPEIPILVAHGPQ
jgi:hypothetical protein